MIDFGFKDVDDNVTYLSDIDKLLANTARMPSLEGSYKQKVIEKTMIGGAHVLNEKKLESGKIKIDFEYFNDNYADFLEIMNALLLVAYNTEYILYEVNGSNRQIKVTFDSWDIPYSVGEMMYRTSGSLSFETLNPFWEDEDYTETTETHEVQGSDGFTKITVNNLGNVPTRPVVWAYMPRQTLGVMPEFEIYVDETKATLRISDTEWGDALHILEMNCLDGTVRFYFPTGYSTSRMQSIVDHTGFFEIPPGVQDLYFYFLTNGDPADYYVTIKHKNRYAI